MPPHILLAQRTDSFWHRVAGMMKLGALAFALLCLSAWTAQAARIHDACLESARSNADAALCTCLQTVADPILSDKDQKLAASFFAEPHKSQVIRMSDRRYHDAFWDRYKDFGQKAVRACR